MNDEASLTETTSILSEAASISEAALMSEAALKDRFNKEASMMRLQLVSILCRLNVIASIRCH